MIEKMAMNLEKLVKDNSPFILPFIIADIGFRQNSIAQKVYSTHIEK
jgi:hypothetical protein